MANISKYPPNKRIRLSQDLSMRLVPDDATDEELHASGYYRGFPCPLEHRIRDLKHHWCYKCALKIQSNLCAFDINYLSSAYHKNALKIWNATQRTDYKECWECKWLKNPEQETRIYMPSYRSALRGRASDRVTLSKAVYTLCWGDVGSLSVTRTCGNPKCLNPLHLTSSWNNRSAPRTMTCFTTELNYRKLMLAAQTLKQNKDLDLLLSVTYKATIEDPKLKKVEEK